MAEPRLALSLLLAGSGLGCAVGESGAAEFRFVEDEAGGRLHLHEGELPLFSYNFGDQLAAGFPADRTRSCYLHPIHGLDGEILTADFQKDHSHHRGLSLMWPRMKVGARKLELWHIRGIRTRFGEWLERRAARDRATLRIRNHWVLDDGTKVATETARFVVHRERDSGRAIDVEFRLEAHDEAIQLQGQVGKGYGGLNLRLAPGESTVLTTDQGRQPADSDRQRFLWADLSDRFGGGSRMSGAALFVHPSHPDAPVGWTLRHYGDLNAAWPGLQPFTLRPGEPLVLAYRVWLHRGDASGVAEAYRRYREGR
ncbi:MAG: DUF6807 family protein [Planctomycetota bacterium]